MKLTYALVVLVSLILNGCSTFSSNNTRYDHEKDFTPDRVNLASIQNPTPVSEPLSAIGNGTSYKVKGKRYYRIKDARNFKQKGIASWYGMKFHGHRTSNGEVYDVYKMTAAHKTLPLPSYVKVTRQDNQKSVIVRVNDRGPFHEGRAIDLSYAAAVKLGIDKLGTAPVTLEVLAVPLDQSQRWIQAAALTNNEKAYQLKHQLQSALNSQWPVTIRNIIKNTGATLYRVQVGPVVEDHLDDALNMMSQAGFTDSLVLMQHQL